MAYASCRPSPAGVPAFSPLLHSPPVVAQETSSLLLEEGLPGAQRTGDGGQRGPGREVMGPGQTRWPREKSVTAQVGRQENLGEEGTGILGLSLHRNHWKCCKNEIIKVAGAETADSDRSGMSCVQGQKVRGCGVCGPHALSGWCGRLPPEPHAPTAAVPTLSLWAAGHLLSLEWTFTRRL